VIFPCQGSHAQASQLIYSGLGFVWIRRGIADDELEWSSEDPARVIHFASSQLESGEQMSARLDPARPRKRDDSADPDGVFVTSLCFRGRSGRIHALPFVSGLHSSCERLVLNGLRPQ
jgi:hypothetical protein